MRKALLIVALMAGPAVPVVAHAQMRWAPGVVPAAAVHQTPAATIATQAEWLAIGAGVIAGAVVLQAILPPGVVYIVAGLAGANVIKHMLM